MSARTGSHEEPAVGINQVVRPPSPLRTMAAASGTRWTDLKFL